MEMCVLLVKQESARHVIVRMDYFASFEDLVPYNFVASLQLI